jgi:DNA-binding MltR family transcriptional regulator
MEASVGNWLSDLIAPAAVLVSSSRLDKALREAIQTRMHALDNQLKARLFENYGPLSTFSAKIDIAYALSLFDANMHHDLSVIRKIRNTFAHPSGPINKTPSFDDEQLLSLCKRFKGYNLTCEPRPIFLFGIKVAECILVLSQDQGDLEMAKKTLAEAPNYPAVSS